MIPDFTESGYLPEGIHLATFEEFEARFNFSQRRKRLIKGLKLAITHLKEIACQTLYIDGSFVTTKLMPGDYDAAWKTDGVELHKALIIYPIFVDLSKGTKNQKKVYGGEFFPAEVIEGGSGEPFLAFFQKDRYGNKKGIIQINI